jgi:O-antigen ligase
VWLTRRKRTFIVAAATAALVIAANASEGAYFSQSWGWVALAFLIPTTVLLILDRATAPGSLRIAFVTLYAALASWIALSALWSISSSSSIREVERMLVYVALAFAVAFLLRRGDTAALVAGALGGIAVVVTYGLATRLFPDRLEGADDQFNAYRLAEPLGYWNAFGLLAVLGILLALGVLAHARRLPAAVAASAMLPALFAGLYFTFSRGSWIALGFGLVATVALDPRRIRLLWSAVAVAPASVAALVVASRHNALTTEGSPLAAATREGHRLVWVLAALILASTASGWLAYVVAERVAVGPRIRRLVSACLAAGAVGAVGLALLLAGGPAAALGDLRDRFEAAPTASGPDLNDRLFDVSSNGRVETIGVAWDVGREHPLAGAGAGTFEYVWYERRPSQQIVRDAHSLYAEVFAELGIVGLVLLATALVMPLAAVIRARRARYVAPAGGAYLAWIAAAGLEWHWEMVALTMTALLLGGAALLAAERRPVQPLPARARVPLVGLGVVASLFAVWSLVGNQALFAARESTAREEWNEALDAGRRARGLLAWSHEPEFELSRAAAGAGDRVASLAAARDTVAEDPNNWVAWLQLAQVASGAERVAAYDRVRELNPREEGLPGE